MESKKIQIITLALATLSLFGVVVMAAILYTTIKARQEGIGKNAPVYAPLVRKDFIGLPESASLETRGQKKVITLRGKEAVGNDSPYQLTGTEEGAAVKIAIDETTNIFRVIPSSEKGKAPTVQKIPFGTFTITALDEVYIATFDSIQEDRSLGDVVATALAIYSNK